MIYSSNHILKLKISHQILFLLFVCMRKMARYQRIKIENSDLIKLTELGVEILNTIGTIFDLLEQFKKLDLIMEPILKDNIIILCNDLKLEKYFLCDIKLEVEKFENILKDINAGTN